MKKLLVASLLLGMFFLFSSGCANTINETTTTTAPGTTTTTTIGGGTSTTVTTTTTGPTVSTSTTTTSSTTTSTNGNIIDAYSGWNSIAVDGSGKAHISYVGNNSLRYATNASGSWVTASLESVSYNYIDSKTSLAVDGSGKIYICFVDFINSSSKVLKYATNKTGAWTVEAVNSNVADTSPFLAIDSSNEAHICYEGQNGDLNYATNASGSWVNTQVDAAVWPARPSLVVTSSGAVYIAYFDLVNYDLKCAANTGGGWVPEVVVNGYLGGQMPYYCTSIALDKNNHLYISYYDDSSPDCVRYATNAGGPWASYKVGNIGLAAGYYTSIGVDPDDHIHVIYYDLGNGLRYANNISGSWESTIIEGDFDSSMAMDTTGKAHICYSGSLSQLEYIVKP
jgi:hypothetical protein